MSNDNQHDTFPKLFYPETANALFVSSGQDSDAPSNEELKDFLKFLMFGFSVAHGGMLVTLVDKEHVYNNAEEYCDEANKTMRPFCHHWRVKCGMVKTCKKFDRCIADILLENDERDNDERDDELWKLAKERLEAGTWHDNGDAVIYKCYAGMYDMAYRIRVAGRPFAILVAGQISPDIPDENKEDWQDIENNLRYWLSTRPENKSDIDNQIVPLQQAMREDLSKLFKPEAQPDSLIKLGWQLETIFENLYRTKRHNSEDAILSRSQNWCKQMNREMNSDNISRFNSKQLSRLLSQQLSQLLSHLKDALEFETIVLFRGEGPLKPERSMKLFACSHPRSSCTIDFQEIWTEFSDDKKFILLPHKSRTDLYHYLNKILKIDISNVHPAIIVVNDYRPSPIYDHLNDNKLPFLILGIGKNSNLPGIHTLLRHLLRELENFTETPESQKKLDESNTKREIQSQFHEHEIGKSVQAIIHMYSRMRNLARDISDSNFHNKWMTLNDLLLNKNRHLVEIAKLPKKFAEEENKVPDFDYQIEMADLELSKNNIDL